jgi:hypothetical protein
MPSIRYEYADACNYKQDGIIRLTAPLTLEQIVTIRDALDGDFFIPEQVGVEPVPYSLNGGRDDHPWHTLEDIAYADLDEEDWEQHVYTDDDVCADAVSGPFDPGDLAAAFARAAAEGWRDDA